MNIRTNMLDRLMLKTEKEMNEQLEKLINERTKELNLANQHLEEISNTDALTGLFNRRYFIQHLETLIHSDKVNTFALLYIDTNRFKPINDSYGHEIGDKVLQELGLRFSAYNLSELTCFRIGGDEFAVIIENCSDVSEITNIAHKIFEMLQHSISVPPYSFTLTASIGIARYPLDAEDKDILIRYADIAMYEVKSKSYKNNYMFFDKLFIEKINKKYEIEVLLQNADYDNEFMLYYQPQYSTDTQALIGMEALIRWKQPQNGLISPSEFIPIAEETGLIIQIGEWVVEKAFSQIKKWNELNSMDLKMSINISPIQIKNTDFANWLWKKMQNEKIKPEWIDLEITESVAMISTSSIEKAFDFLNEIGVSISIDDFGTGYSSLSYIRKYNIDRLKIAKELIDHIAYDENALLIVQTIIMMSRGMNLKTISEGVEDMEQLEILKELGCDEIQGYIFGKPIPSLEFEKLHLNKN
ncbi:putative bifunctional diguanylate cyclase/phosphodiesterase [Anaerotignum sp.]|uniref:putative bifunctional diguanylate cyclase/phosphodiesterase n=1 Tax=Anaerotignum sp. TaxID=2039241 RepID=UPI002714B494|nr:bifunctional diguanylate cyclase/phosphodiesterase [Anaerotignum sp.]